MELFCISKGISHQYSAPRTPQQNGVAERKNRTLIEAARTMLSDSKLPVSFWAEAVNTACYVLNRVSLVKRHNKTSYELINKRKPNLQFLEPFGCPCEIMITKERISKFGEKTHPGYFLGYSAESPSKRVFDKTTGTIEEAYEVTCFRYTPPTPGDGPKHFFDYDSLFQSFNIDYPTASIPVARHEAVVMQGGGTDDTFFDQFHTQSEDASPSTSSGPNPIQVIVDLPAIQQAPVRPDSPGYTTASESEAASEAGSETASEDSFQEPSAQFEGGDEEESNEIQSAPQPSNAGVSNPAPTPDEAEIPAEIPTQVLEIVINQEVVQENEGDVERNEAEDVISPRRSVREKKRPAHLDDFVASPALLEIFEACFLSQIDPKNVIIALDDPFWVEAMQEELQQFLKLHVWERVKAPRREKILKTKWVFKIKKDDKGEIVRNKARLVVQGFEQVEGLDYDEVYAPVARLESIRLFLAFASHMRFKVYQLDVKSAFLYGEIREDIYVAQPPGFEDYEHPDHVYKLNKALYGLHQAPRAWYGTLSDFLTNNGFARGSVDQTLFTKKKDEHLLLVQIYVDDIIFGSTDDSMCKEFEKLMTSRFEMSAMGEMNFFLGLQVKQSKKGIYIHQTKYVQDILTRFEMLDCRAVSTPLEINHKLGPALHDDAVDLKLYRSMIGSLMYLTASRPDITFAVSLCARYQAAPKACHLKAVKRILCYLKGKPTLGLWYPYDDQDFELTAYSDSDYGGCNSDMKSTTGGCQFLGSRLVSWQCKKQTAVSLSSAEAEYIAAGSCCSQVLWIQHQLRDYGLIVSRTPINIDNTAAVCIIRNPVQHSKTKHISIRFHFIRDCYDKNLITLLQIATEDQKADLLTKAFHKGRFEELIKLNRLITLEIA